jgi:hypothetical protein
MNLPPPDPSLFQMVNVLADAIALANMVLDYWMVILGMGLGTAIMIMIFKHFNRAMP